MAGKVSSAIDRRLKQRAINKAIDQSAASEFGKVREQNYSDKASAADYWTEQANEPPATWTPNPDYEAPTPGSEDYWKYYHRNK
jgi:hypothetical protein